MRLCLLWRQLEQTLQLQSHFPLEVQFRYRYWICLLLVFLLELWVNLRKLGFILDFQMLGKVQHPYQPCFTRQLGLQRGFSCYVVVRH